MQLRRFSAESAAAVLAQIKAELGPDAVILDTQEQSGVITMTAALERPEAAMPQPRPMTAADSQDMALPTGWQQWHEEWSNIKGHLLSLMKPTLKLETLPPRQRLAIEFLQREGVEDDAFLDLFSKLQEDPATSILEHLGRITPIQPWGGEAWPQRVHVIAGPFGAGKTSVTIRLALALRKSMPEARICLINADATRGNGRLLLRHYSELSDMAYKEASTTMELVAALAMAHTEGFDRIFIDLPGLSRGKLLQTLLDNAGLGTSCEGGVAVHITMPPHHGGLHMRGLLTRYQTTHAGSIIWTKLDEAEHFGQIINVAFGTRLPVSALSFGPGLGNSLLPAKEALLWRLIFKRETP